MEVSARDHIAVVGEDQQSAAAYSPWEGWEFTGRVRHTFVRGNRVFSLGEDFGPATGRFLARHLSGFAALEAQRG